MTKGEEQLRKDLSAVVFRPYEIDLIVEVVKSGAYYVNLREIRELQEHEWVDWEDGCDQYTVFVEDIPLEKLDIQEDEDE